MKCLCLWPLGVPNKYLGGLELVACQSPPSPLLKEETLAKAKLLNNIFSGVLAGQSGISKDLDKVLLGFLRERGPTGGIYPTHATTASNTPCTL